MAENQPEEVKLVKIEKQEGEHQRAEGDESQPAAEKKFHKNDSKWEIIDKIKASDEQTVVINIFKVHPEATWKDIKEVYREFQMKIDKVVHKEGMFNLHFHNHNDAINFIKVSPKPILDKKFTMRLNDRIKPNTNGGWNEMGAGGHTAKFETKKYFKSQANGPKKPFTKRTEEGEHEEGAVEGVEHKHHAHHHHHHEGGAEGEHKHHGHHHHGHHHHHHEEQTEEEQQGLELPTRTIGGTEKPAEERTRKISNEEKPRRFIGDVQKREHHHRDNNNHQDHGFGHRNKEWKKDAPQQKEGATTTTAATEKPAAEKPAVATATVKPQTEEWNTVKDVVKEKKVAEDAKRKQDKLQKEKEAQEKKAQETKTVQATEKVAVAAKKPVSNFSDGW